MDSYDAGRFPPQDLACPRCGVSGAMRFSGPCPSCIAELQATIRGERVQMDAEYVPKVNVTANAVAVKDD
jgi:hypothetical protein